jgi:hypothetical protein
LVLVVPSLEGDAVECGHHIRVGREVSDIEVLNLLDLLTLRLVFITEQTASLVFVLDVLNEESLAILAIWLLARLSRGW